MNWFLNMRYVIQSDLSVKRVYEWRKPQIKESAKISYTATVSVMFSIHQAVSNIGSASSRRNCMPKLSADELLEGCKLGLDTWADTCCAGRHTHVLEFVEGKYVTARGFASELPEIKNLPIANIVYAYDTPNGETLLLRVNNAIYIGQGMEDSLLQPNQCREHGIEIDTRPKHFCPNNETAETLCCPESDRTIDIKHFGPLPYIPIRRPTASELLSCEVLELTSPSDWDLYDPDSAMTSVLSKVKTDSMKEEILVMSQFCAISTTLMNVSLDEFLLEARLIRETEIENDYVYISAFATRKRDVLQPDQLAKLWRIGLHTAKRTIEATTHQCIKTVGNF